MLPEDQGPAETAIAFTDDFIDAGLAKLDTLFGAGYTKEHPQALAAYVAACASNLEAFMTAAAAAMEDASFDEAFAAFEEDLRPEPAEKPKGRRR
jgi:hypothetical protein